MAGDALWWKINKLRKQVEQRGQINKIKYSIGQQSNLKGKQITAKTGIYILKKED